MRARSSSARAERKARMPFPMGVVRSSHPLSRALSIAPRAGYPGLRRGELLALTWDNVYPDKSRISVCQSLQQTNAGVSLKVPKAGRGRQVALPAFAVDALRAHRVRQAQDRLRLGPLYIDHGLVFPRPETGGYWEPISFTSAFAAAVRKSGLPRVNFHSLRHSHATIFLNQGINPKVVSERLGHAKVGTTLDVYSHVLPCMQDEAAQRLERTFRIALSK